MTVAAPADELARARAVWIAGAAQARFGKCDACGQREDENGKPLYVARAERARSFKCFICSSTPTKRRRSMATKTNTTGAPAEVVQRFEMLALARLEPAPDNPRREVGDVTEMAQSMSELGMIEPLVVTPRNGHFLIVAGHRRFAAATLAKLAEVPVMVRDFTEEQRVKAMLIENLQREGLAPLEEAGAYHRLVEEFGVSQRELAQRVGRSQGHISKRIALLKLPESVRALVDSGGITQAEAAELGKLDGNEASIARVLNRERWESFEGAVESELEQNKKRAKLEADAVKAEKGGHTVVRWVLEGYRTKLPKGTYFLQKGATYGSDVLTLDPGKHGTDEKLDCHAFVVDPASGAMRAVCTNRKNHPGAKTPDERHRDAMKTQYSGRDDEYAKRQAREQALKQAAELRREFVYELAERKATIGKEEAVGLVLGHAIVEAWANVHDRARVLGLAGLADVPALDAAIDRGNATELNRIALVFTLAALDSKHCRAWSGACGGWDEDERWYLELLERHGYEISEAERAALPKPAKTAKAAA